MSPWDVAINPKEKKEYNTIQDQLRQLNQPGPKYWLNLWSNQLLIDFFNPNSWNQIKSLLQKQKKWDVNIIEKNLCTQKCLNLIKNGLKSNEETKSVKNDKIHWLFNGFGYFQGILIHFQSFNQHFNQKWIKIHQKLIKFHCFLLKLRWI